MLIVPQSDYLQIYLLICNIFAMSKIVDTGALKMIFTFKYKFTIFTGY